MSLYARIWTVFGLASHRLLAIAVIVMTVSATAFAENPNSSDSLSTKRDSALATAGKNPIQCEVAADVKTDAAVLACKFPLDIDAYQLGFYVLADNANQEEKDLIIACYWENTPTASLRCFPKDNSKVNEKYEKSTSKAILSIPMATARSYNLSCHLSHFTLPSRQCQLTGSVHRGQMSCNWVYPAFFLLLVPLVISVFVNAVLLINKCECGAKRIAILRKACKHFRKTSRSSAPIGKQAFEEAQVMLQVLAEKKKLDFNKPHKIHSKCTKMRVAH